MPILYGNESNAWNITGHNASRDCSHVAPNQKRWCHPMENTKAGLGIRRWWQCKKDPSHIWELSPDKMKGPRKSGYCQQCRSPGVQHPHLIPFWHSQKNGYVTPFDVFSCAGKKYWWRCLENPKARVAVIPQHNNKTQQKTKLLPLLFRPKKVDLWLRYKPMRLTISGRCGRFTDINSHQTQKTFKGLSDNRTTLEKHLRL